MIERIIGYAIIALAIVASIAYITNGVISVFRKKESPCSCCGIEKTCKKRKE
ncbi:MAG: hypothetical protein ACP5QT_01520 [Brevinematia bacterium]